MVFIAEAPLCVRKNVEKPQCSVFQNENSVYLQPTRRCAMRYIRPYKKSVIKIDSDTTYGLSYMKLNGVPKLRANYGIHEKQVVKNPGQFDFDTVYKLSYQASDGTIPKPFIPKSSLSISGSQDMMTVHKISYRDPGYVEVKSYKPHRGKVQRPVCMDSETITKESYPNFGMPIEVKRPSKPKVWQTKFKTDYQTTSHLSYQYMGPIAKKSRIVPCKLNISSQIGKDTIYSTSYSVPGRFANKEYISK